MTPAEGELVIQIKPWSLCTLHQWVGADLQLSEADSTKPAAESGVLFQNKQKRKNAGSFMCLGLSSCSAASPLPFEPVLLITRR